MKSLIVSAACAALLLAACGQDEKSATTDAPKPATTEAAATEPALLSNGMTAAATIELRQKKFKEMGKANKTISDQLKGEPDLDAIKSSAAVVAGYSRDIGNWFPAGSGPEAGVKTEALSKIWDDADGYAAVIAKFQEAAGSLETAVDAGDMEAIGAAFRMTGGQGCKSCHDNYRLDD